MKKRVVSIILILSMLAMFMPSGLGSMIAQAASGDFTIENGVLKKYSGSGGDVVIPGSVTIIGDWAFNECHQVTSVTIPNSVTKIGEYAFEDCRSLTSIIIPNSVTTIGKAAFDNCINLTSVKISDSVTSIGERAFAVCSCLTTITIPNSVTSIGEGAFAYCCSLTSINVLDGNSHFVSENGVLYNKLKTVLISCPGGKRGSFIIPNSVSSILVNSFGGCNSLTSVIIPDSVTSIGDYAFCECRGLTSISIPKSVTSIGNSIFRNCSNLQSIIIPNSVTSIGNNAFYYCSRLTTISLPNSVISIGNWAFSECRSVKSVVIPNSVTSIGDYAFYDCSNLTSVTLSKTILSIGKKAFSDCECLTNVTIPNYATSIGAEAFSWCKSLESVTIPSSISSIGEKAFINCDSLKDIYYTGSQLQWKRMLINENEDEIDLGLNRTATIHYNFGKTPPSIISQPISKTVKFGSSVTLSLKAEGDGLTYQWYYQKAGQTKFNAWENRTHASESCKPNATWNGIQLYCIVKDRNGNSVQSNTIKVTFSDVVTIVTQPANVSAKAGESVKLTVKAEGVGLSYQWYYKKSGAKSWTKWSKQTKSTVSIKMASGWNKAQFYCLVKNKAGKSVKTQSAKATLLVEFKITTQPKNKTVKTGKTATFSIKATGNGLKYQWYYKKKGAKSWTKWSGKTKASVSLKATKAWNGAQFYCKVTDGNKKTANSKSAKLTLKK